MKNYRQYSALHKAGKYKEAFFYLEPLLKQTAIEYGPTHKLTIALMDNLAMLYRRQWHYGKAEQLYRRSLKIKEQKLGPYHLDVATSLNELAGLYNAQGRYGFAEKLYQRSLNIREQKLGLDHLDVATNLNNIALLKQQQGHYREAEQLYRRSLKIMEKKLGPDDLKVATVFGNLAGVYESQGRYSEAEKLFKRSLKIRKQKLEPDHLDVASSLNSLATFYHEQRRDGKAIVYYKRSLAILKKKLGEDDLKVATLLSNLAALYQEQGRYSEAEQLFKHCLKIRGQKLEPDHPDVGTSLNNLATLYHKQRRYGDAIVYFKRSLVILKKVLGEDHPKVAGLFSNLAGTYFVQRDWREAATNMRQATDLLIRRAARSNIIGQGITGQKKSEVTQNSLLFSILVKSVFRDSASQANSQNMFKNAQWAMGSEVAQALAQTSARMGAGSSELAAIVRERQDKVSEWQANEKRVNALRGAGKSDEKLEAQMVALERRIATIDKKLDKEFPDYAALATPKPLSVEQVHKLLGPDEALILLLDTQTASPTPAEIFIWAVTKDKVVWKRAELGDKELSAKVTTLRCGVDDGAWRIKGGKERCHKLTGGEYREHKLPFNLAIAHELYSTLFGQIEGDLKGIKHLMVVSSGQLASLPLHLLVTKKPEYALPIKHGLDYEGVPWLAQKYAITTLPSVSSLHALRGIKKKRGRAKKPLIGFGNPVLKGNKTCLVSNATKGGRLTRRSGVQRGVSAFFRGRLANVDEVRKLCPLPGSAKELNAVATDLDAVKEIRLGDKATETAVKKLSKDGKLDDFRIVYFSTHGLLSGGLKGLAEPALVFTPPQKASEGDDGLLTASEVALLKLNADWVVMSACNTAGGDKPGGEALSGLARAFFYSGAKALLVSHWPVYSTAATDLATDTFRRMRGNSEMGRATALQQSMLAFMNDQKYPFNSHPAFWAPFVVVGEGGADTQEAR